MINAKQAMIGSHRAASFIRGAQGQRLIPIVTRERCGTDALSGGLVIMPPGARSRPHLHRRSESIVIVVEGHAATLMGEDMAPMFHGPGDFVFIPEDLPHAAVNLNPEHRIVAIELRTDPDFNEDVELRPEYEEQVAQTAARLQRDFSMGLLPLPAGWAPPPGVPFTYPRAPEWQPA